VAARREGEPNGLLRQYYPKGTNLVGYSPAHPATAAGELNGRPRKTLVWKTPAEALAEVPGPGPYGGVDVMDADLADLHAPTRASRIDITRA
jgi:hypothetical protein